MFWKQPITQRKQTIDTNNESCLNTVIKNIPVENGIFHPRTVEEVKTLVDYARENMCTVRTLGSMHSPSTAIFAQTMRDVHIQLDGELKKVHRILPDISGEYAYVSVGAGCHLGIDPNDKQSTLANAFNYQVDQQGYALPTLGGISHQTIAGFLQTSSSGGSVRHGIADVVEEIELINGKGELCRLKKGEDAFNAAMVSMGLFGIITKVIFKLPKKYLVEGIEENKMQDDSFLKKEDGEYKALAQALFLDHEYAHINWLPQKYVGRTMQWTGKSVDPSLPRIAYHHPLQSSILTYLAAAVLKFGNLADTVGGNHSLALRMKSLLLRPFANLNQRKHFRDEWYRALPIDDQADVDGVINTAFSEIWFPKESLNEVMQKLETLFLNHPEAAGNFIVELYAAKQSPYWLSPAYGYDAFRVDLYWWKHNRGTAEAYFSRFWEVLLPIAGARLHWGKCLPTPNKHYDHFIFDHDMLRSQYPKFDEWLRWRESMDPDQLFVSQYWRTVFNLPEMQRDRLQYKMR